MPSDICYSARVFGADRRNNLWTSSESDCQSASKIDPLSACNIDPLSGTAEVVPVINRGDPSGFV